MASHAISGRNLTQRNEKGMKIKSIHWAWVLILYVETSFLSAFAALVLMRNDSSSQGVDQAMFAVGFINLIFFILFLPFSRIVNTLVALPLTWMGIGVAYLSTEFLLSDFEPIHSAFVAVFCVIFLTGEYFLYSVIKRKWDRQTTKK